MFITRDFSFNVTGVIPHGNIESHISEKIHRYYDFINGDISVKLN